MPSADRFALVTGTSAGIGANVAERLLANGWAVVGVARRAAPFAHPRYRHLTLDLADLSSSLPVLDEAIARACREARRRVALVNNAAMGGLLAPVERVDALALHRMTAVNVVAPVHLMGRIVESAEPNAVLRIVNISSGAAVRAFPGLSAYSASKAALRMAGMVLAAELDSPLRTTPAPHDRAIVSYEPGAVDTDMQTRARALSDSEFPWVGVFRDFASQGRLLDPAAPAAEIVALLERDGLPTFSERRYGVR